jgi:uncharacterized protein (DUF342 family)
MYKSGRTHRLGHVQVKKVTHPKNIKLGSTSKLGLPMTDLDRELLERIRQIEKSIKRIEEKLEILEKALTDPVRRRQAIRELLPWREREYLERMEIPVDACPDCWEKGKKIKGEFVEKTEFEKSIVYTFKCPECGKTWVSQCDKGWKCLWMDGYLETR